MFVFSKNETIVLKKRLTTLPTVYSSLNQYLQYNQLPIVYYTLY